MLRELLLDLCRRVARRVRSRTAPDGGFHG
jgi:hypothetical protein